MSVGTESAQALLSQIANLGGRTGEGHTTATISVSGAAASRLWSPSLFTQTQRESRALCKWPEVQGEEETPRQRVPFVCTKPVWCRGGCGCKRPPPPRACGAPGMRLQLTAGAGSRSAPVPARADPDWDTVAVLAKSCKGFGWEERGNQCRPSPAPFLLLGQRGFVL